MIEKALLIGFSVFAIAAISAPAANTLRSVGEKIQIAASRATNPTVVVLPCQNKFGGEIGCFAPAK
jgi:predicted small secreted protein